jgi:hypothetical protein
MGTVLVLPPVGDVVSGVGVLEGSVSVVEGEVQQWC